MSRRGRQTNCKACLHRGIVKEEVNVLVVILGRDKFTQRNFKEEFLVVIGVVGWCEGVVYLKSPGRPTDIGLQLGQACYPCSR